MIDEYAGETVGHGAFDERRRHGGIHTAREPQHHFVPAHRLADLFHFALDVSVHGVVACRPAHLVEEIADDPSAASCALHLGVELHAVQPLLLARDGCGGTIRRDRHDLEACGHPRDIVGVAHQRAHRALYAFKEHAGTDCRHFRRAVLGHLARAHLAAQRRAHHLHTVTYPQHGDAEVEDGGIRLWRVLRVHAERPAREDYADGRGGAHLFCGRRARENDGVHLEPAHRARDELLILPAEIKHQYRLMFLSFHSPL